MPDFFSDYSNDDLLFLLEPLVNNRNKLSSAEYYPPLDAFRAAFPKSTGKIFSFTRECEGGTLYVKEYLKPGKTPVTEKNCRAILEDLMRCPNNYVEIRESKLRFLPANEIYSSILQTQTDRVKPAGLPTVIEKIIGAYLLDQDEISDAIKRYSFFTHPEATPRTSCASPPDQKNDTYEPTPTVLVT